MFKCARKCSLLVLVAVIFAGCAGTPPSARLSSSTTSPAKSADSEQTTKGLSDVFDEDRSQNMAITTTSEAVDLDRWPLTGLQDEGVGTWAVLMVKIDNHDRARPQAGINSADVVFEEIVEGGLTRFAALFHSQQTELLGPIRSVRTSDFNLLRNLNRPLFANSGGNEAVLRLLQEIDYVDVSSNAAIGAYKRVEERPSPHNLFSDTESLRAVGTSRGEGGPPPTMFLREVADDVLAAPSDPVRGLNIDYGSTVVQYRWNQDTKWVRNQNGTPHLDSDGVAVAPDVVIVQVVSYGRSRADGRSPEAVLLGEGKALVFFDGKVTEGFWRRTNAEEMTQYFDRDGQTIAMPSGRIWVALPRVGQTQIVE